MSVLLSPTGVETIFPCTEIEFLVARTMLDGQSLNKLRDSITGNAIENPRRVSVARVFSMGRYFAHKNNIPLFTSRTSERIVRALEQSGSLSRRGLAGFVRQKLDGIICSAPSQNLLQATATVQADIEWNKKVGSDYVIAMARLKHRSMTMTELAEAQGITTAGISGGIGRLERLGHVTRTSDSDDSRVVNVALTDKGKQLIEKLEKFLTTV